MRPGDSTRNSAHPATRQRGFTFIELCFGLVITSLVMSALAAFTLAMAQGWRHAEQVGQTHLQARAATLRLSALVKDARLIGAISQGATSGTPNPPAAFIVWVADSNGDAAIQGAECAMVEHDPASGTLRLYPAGQGDATTVLSWNVFTAPAVLTNFKVGRDWQPISRGVEAVRFTGHGIGHSELNPTLEYTLKLRAPDAGAADQDKVTIEYGTCVVRAPARQPA